MNNHTIILLASAIAPVAIVLAWTWRRDRLPEPPKVVMITFALGALATIPIMLGEMLLSSMLGLGASPQALLQALLLSFVVAALVEETFKFLVLSRYAATHSAFDEPYDGIVYGVAASLGFACVENIVYVLGASGGSFGAGMIIAVARALLAVPLHTCCGAIMGVCIGVARFKGAESRTRWTVAGIAAAILLHGIYDSFVFGGQVAALDRNTAMIVISTLGTLGTTAAGFALAVAGAAWLRRAQRAPTASSSQA